MAAPHQSPCPMGLPPLPLPHLLLPALVPALPEGEFWGNSTDSGFHESQDPTDHWDLLQTAPTNVSMCPRIMGHEQNEGLNPLCWLPSALPLASPGVLAPYLASGLKNHLILPPQYCFNADLSARESCAHHLMGAHRLQHRGSAGWSVGCHGTDTAQVSSLHHQTSSWHTPNSARRTRQREK